MIQTHEIILRNGLEFKVQIDDTDHCITVSDDKYNWMLSKKLYAIIEFVKDQKGQITLMYE